MKKKSAPAAKTSSRKPKPRALAPARPKPKSKKSPKPAKSEQWLLRLYVAGHTPKSLTAFSNLKRICDEHLSGRYWIEVIDLLKVPELAQSDQIVALPTLVRKLPAPIKRVIGDLSNLERVLVGMDLRPAPAKKSAN